MKFINIKVLSVLALAVLSLSSCLKDPRYVDFASSPPLTEFPLAAFVQNKTQTVTIVRTTTSATVVKNTNAAGKYVLQVALDVQSVKPLTTSTTATIAVDNTAGETAAAPSASTTGGFFPLPPADYTIDTLTPVIPAGQSTDVLVNITIDPALIGTTFKNYTIRLVIKDGGGHQISNWNTLLYNVRVTN